MGALALGQGRSGRKVHDLVYSRARLGPEGPGATRRTTDSGRGPMRATHRAPAEPRPRRRRYRIHPGWAGVATSIVSELADLLLPPMPEEPFAFFEADDSVRRYRGDGSLRIDTAAGAWCDDRTGEAGGIFGLLAKLLRSRQAAREWVRCDHKEEWKRPWPPRRGPTFQRRPSDREHAEVPLSAVLGRESVTPPPPPRTDPKASCGPGTAARR